jgi:uncharacterized integral membrane protein
MVIGLVAGAIVLVFVLQNSHSNRTHLLFWNLSAPQWLWMIILFGCGVVVGSVFPWFRRRETSRKGS